jgi:hypothetical protein
MTLPNMNADLFTVPTFCALCRALLLAGGTLLIASSCNTPPANGPGANVFVPGQPRYGYGSPQQGSPYQSGTADRTTRNPNTPRSTERKTPDIKRDPRDTTVDVTPPEPKPDKKNAPDASAASDGTSDSNEGSNSAPPSTPETKPAAPREDLPYGQPVVGKKGFVYSPYAPDKGQVDVQDIPAGTKVKCPYTEKTFRVP